MLSVEQLRERAIPRDEIPKQERICCVYFLFDRDRLIYIGSSIFLAQRLARHGHKRFQSVAIIEASKNEIRDLESRYQAQIPVESAYLRSSVKHPVVLFFEEETAGKLRDAAEKFGKRIAGIIDNLVDLYMPDLEAMYEEQAEAEEQRRRRLAR